MQLRHVTERGCLRGMEEQLPRIVDEELTRVVKEYMPLVLHAVSRVGSGSRYSGILQHEDMVSYGVQGLLEAHHSYDSHRGAKFSTYALPRIRGSILDAMRASRPLPRSLQKVSSDIERAISSLYGDLGRPPTKVEIAERMGLPLADLLAAARATSIRVLSLEGLAAIATSRVSEKLMEMADDDPAVNPETFAQGEFLRGRLAHAMACLPLRERQIIRLYYLESWPLKSIGAALAISESRASQLRKRAMHRLRSTLEHELAVTS